MPTLFEAPVPKTKKHVGSHHAVDTTHVTGFTAYATKPDRVRFETQEPDEEVILFLRQHLIFVVPWLIVGGILLIVPTILIPLLLRVIGDSVFIPGSYFVVGTVFWYVAVFGFMLSKLIHWFFNIFIVTDQRIVDIDFVNLLYKELSEAKVSRVQDISYQMSGVFATMFNYGDVYIQTAGEVPNFVFEGVPKPAKVVEIISDVVRNTKIEDL